VAEGEDMNAETESAMPTSYLLYFSATSDNRQTTDGRTMGGRRQPSHGR